MRTFKFHQLISALLAAGLLLVAPSLAADSSAPKTQTPSANQSVQINTQVADAGANDANA